MKCAYTVHSYIGCFVEVPSEMFLKIIFRLAFIIVRIKVGN